MFTCDKCNTNIGESSLYCPQCGDPVTNEDQITKEASAFGSSIVHIIFGNSISANYEKALNICKKLSSYECIGEGKQIQHKVTLPLTEVELVANLFDLVGSWKSSQMLINGQPATKKDLTYHGIGCYRSRQKSYKPKVFCYGERQQDINIWGCKKLGMPIYEWGGGWLEYGFLESNGVWRFDKERIRHELEVALKENELCPILNRSQVLKTLEQLPETINPKIDKNWEYRTTHEEINGSYKEVVIGVRPILKNVNKYIIEEINPDWDIKKTPIEISTINIDLDFSENPKNFSKIYKYKKIYIWIWFLLIFIFLIALFKR